MKSVSLVFAVHNHQPIGNFESVLEDAYRLAYRPFLDVLEKHPSIKFTQHWTGTLLDWLVARHPEVIERMKPMVQNGQLELLTGSYYEAILAVIPEADRVGQIRKLSDRITALFNFTPRGMWLAERVWEQHLVRPLAEAGVEFVMVDDTHFRHAGLRDEQLLGYYVTEEEGYKIKVLPIDKTLRYTVPFRVVEETQEYLRRVATEDGTALVVHADDGEKFGVWPKTFNSVYEQGWLERFFHMIEEHQEWIHTTHAGAVIDTIPPLGRIYLPTASYAEMMKWALNPVAFIELEHFERHLKEERRFEDSAMFVQGGFWRNFLAKYPEANQMHKKMLRVAHRAHALALHGAVPDNIFDDIWAGQCNDSYWHGVFGGLYLPNLRFPVFHRLLVAESKLDQLEQRPGVRLEETDFDCDGLNEAILESSVFDFCFKPSSGGSLVELDHKPTAVNLLDIMSRREEGYHRRLAEGLPAPGQEKLEVKEPGLEKHLHFDWYRHASLTDHFFGDVTIIEGLAQCRYPELGDFVNQPYRYSGVIKGNTAEVTLERDGALWFGSQPHRLTVRKVLTYTDGDDQFTVEYFVANREQTPVDVWFGVEWNVGAMAGDATDRYYDIEGRALTDKRLRSRGEEQQVLSFRLVDEWLNLQTVFAVSQAATLWRFPIETVSLSEGGFERIYQGSVVIPHWRFRLEAAGSAGAQFQVRLSQAVRRLREQ